MRWLIAASVERRCLADVSIYTHPVRSVLDATRSWVLVRSGKALAAKAVESSNRGAASVAAQRMKRFARALVISMVVTAICMFATASRARGVIETGKRIAVAIKRV